MKSSMFAMAAVFAVVAAPLAAEAAGAADIGDAIRLCRAEVAAQAGEAATVRLDQASVRARAVRVDLDIWRNGQLENVRCVVDGEPGALRLASLTPALAPVTAALR